MLLRRPENVISSFSSGSPFEDAVSDECLCDNLAVVLLLRPNPIGRYENIIMEAIGGANKEIKSTAIIVFPRIRPHSPSQV